ncbi:hypothetical protein [Leptospira sanjuanensis]|uniref:hypothetical protein n=1 Tax=Leptospira sanjuanensis TaxID=2879643 RepID=UPI001EE847DB|nr:hypothetical protein [Leptospira sanjuanensis]MCG6170215.1 hypothetical protein [Leptospira sanjuanensis]
MDEFSKLNEIKDENFHGVVGYLASIILFLSQFAIWILKKIRELRISKSFEPIYKVKSPYFHSFGEVTRLDIFLKRNLSVSTSEILYEDLVFLYNTAKERNLESIKIEFAHYGTLSHACGFAVLRFLDHVAEYNGIRVVIKFPTNSSDAVKLFLNLQKHRAKSDSGRIELYLNDYSETHTNNS